MRKNVLFAAALAAVLAVGTAHASKTECPDQFVGSSVLDITNPKISAKMVSLCFHHFVVLSRRGVTWTPLWSAEQPIKAHVKDARNQEHINLLHEKEILPVGEWVGDGYREGSKG